MTTRWRPALGPHQRESGAGPTEARHAQAIWLLAQGRSFLEIAEVLAFAPR